MGLLDGKNALVFGVANDHSIAWGIAKAFHDQGARVGFSSIESLIERRVRPLADRIGSTFVEPCDVRDDAQVRAVFDLWSAEVGRLDILVHALAFADRADLDGLFVDTSRGGFALALDVSVYSLVALAREARPHMAPGSSILTLSYYGAEIGGEVPHARLQGCLGHAHDVVVRDDLLGPVVAEREDARSGRHVRPRLPGERDERVDADVEREREPAA